MDSGREKRPLHAGRGGASGLWWIAVGWWDGPCAKPKNICGWPTREARTHASALPREDRGGVSGDRVGNGHRPVGFCPPKPVPATLESDPLKNPCPPRVHFEAQTRTRSGLGSPTGRPCPLTSISHSCRQHAIEGPMQHST